VSDDPGELIFGGDLDWLFWPARRPRPDSAWLGHIPFGHWVVGATQPRILVELGTHAGASFASFCEGVQRRKLKTRCYAVDTWKGDAHSGPYDERVYTDLAKFTADAYGDFATLLRMRFADALKQFADGSVDLLHIDGLHTYDAVRGDFESWLPKLSSRAVVLFHDIAERQPGFGVWKFWEELRQHYPGFGFTHSSGLGVLCVGPDCPAPVRALAETTDPRSIALIQSRFAALGENPRMTATAAKLYREGQALKQALGQAMARAG